MGVSRRGFLKAFLPTAVASGVPLKVFDADEKFDDDVVLIPQASHYVPFKAVVKDGVLIGVQPIEELDARPTEMLLEGILSRTYHPTRIKYPMVRKSYLENPRGDVRPELQIGRAHV